MKQKTFVPFAVDENPYCLWDVDVRAKNLELIEKIDPEYFRYIAETNSVILENSEDKNKRQHASILLRLTYSHALEALFSLLGAAMQAPDCVVGWLLKYRPGDVPTIVEKITQGIALLSNYDPTPRSWHDVAKIVLSPIEQTDSEKYDFWVEKFSSIWKRFAIDYLNPDFHDEYNSVKHGLRFKAAGVFFAINPTNSSDLSDNPIVHANSEFGMSYFKQEKFDKLNFGVTHQSNNWHPMNYCYALTLIATSMTNIITFLRVANGVDHRGLSFMFPEDPESFDKPWEIEQPGAMKISLNLGRPDNSVQLLTADQILSRYSAK